MKRAVLLLAGVAALSVLGASAVQATEHGVELPDEMVGFGCYNEAKSTETEHHYSWGNEDVNFDACDAAVSAVGRRWVLPPHRGGLL
jgi:hypothetical protein